MGFSNSMTDLVNKLEKRLHLRVVANALPDEAKKERWADEVIIPDTLVTFSRYMPREVKYVVNPAIHPKKDGWYILDEMYISPDAKILGVKDLSWEDFAEDSLTYQQNAGLGVYDYVANSFGVMDVSLVQMRADHMSLFNNGIYVEVEPPNKVRLKSSTNADLGRSVGKFRIKIFLEHRHDLTTISPTQMEIFEALAQAEVADYVLGEIKQYGNVELIFANADYSATMEHLEQEAGKKEDVMARLNEGYVSAANKNQPMIYVQ